jgi:FdhD protein
MVHIDMTSLMQNDGNCFSEGFCEGAHSLPVTGIRGGKPFVAQDWVADEVPVALEFNGISHAVMLATPLDLEDFALGFCLSEGILNSADELFSVDEHLSEAGITLQLRVAGAAFDRLKNRRRAITGRTGCGLCGVESLAQVHRELNGATAEQFGANKPPRATVTAIAPAAIGRAMAQLASLQTLQQATGAVHAAAWCNAQGDVQWLREDVGRHNALDKLIGALAHHDIAAATGFVTITSRASFEMVQKAAMVGVPVLAAVSAPTGLAVSTARRLGLAVVGFARQGDLVVYSHPERITLPKFATAPVEPAHAH